MKERIQKLLSEAGIASRRAAEEWIRAGRVRVNGSPAQLGDTADRQTDRVEVDGVLLPAQPEKQYIMLNKPRGFVTTLSDEQGRRTVLELLQGCDTRVYPVGRLDLNSEGLLLLTNDGELANRLMHPRHGIKKSYEVHATGFQPGADAMLLRPIELDGRPISKPEVKVVWRKDTIVKLEITICEGRNRQIRRMCDAAALHVTRLRRIAEGPLELGNLETGCWRHLTAAEVAALKREE